tara:strand:+ start:34 stop:876 length:843 start_codon:yes stop_codon:yes gene_type:complete
MILKSFSKINLSLTVNKRLKSKHKLHNIQSYFCLIDLFDKIKIKKITGKKDIIKFHGKFGKLVNKKDNSIVSVLNLLRKKNIISDQYMILINKRIPVFAGLGGGTSNSAFLIKYLAKKKNNKLLLKYLGTKIGSDLKLFFYKQGFLSNLNTINTLPKKHKLHFLLVYPNIKCSTKYIYSKVKIYSPKSKYNLKKLKTTSKFVKLLASKHNDLQSIVENKYPIIKKIIKDISKRKGCHFSRMTGSGSVCYGVFESKKSAKAALNSIRSKYPNYWLSVAKTI